MKKTARRWLIITGIVLGLGLAGGLSFTGTSGVQNASLTVPTATAAEAVMVPVNFTELAEKAKPGVVNIRTVKTTNGGGPVFRHFFGRNPHGGQDPFQDFFGLGPQREFKQRSLGSGFLLDNEGYIVTNNHVVEDADQIKVRLSDEAEYDATIIGRDPKTDLALIKIDAPSKDLKPLKLGDSDTIPVGSWVVAIGSPFGLEQTVTAGIVSAKGRIIGSGPYDDFIQTDASINPGNSGGPLLNLKGEVVGINTAIVASGQGIGFAIPINMAGGIINQLKDSGEVSRGWLGVGIQDLTPELAEYYAIKEKEGVLVTQTYEGDPADKAGIKEGDVIVAVDGKRIASSRELSRTVAEAGVGNKMSLTVLRDGREKEIDVKLAKRPDTEPTMARGEARSDDLGLKVREIDPEIAERLGLDENTKGVVVTGVNPDSKAAEADIRQGDVVIEINRKPVTSLEDYKDQLRKIDTGDTVQMLLRRGGGGLLAVKFKR
ncbi:MAG: DegQ family serine endoprotease [Desulfobacteraceae bacterium]|nr:DegQ family serine endoprotease [Desulfobacteraceae bacterium]MBC2752399.1 DegQ family serine endoprotease [Desulfobacteraceae bacterium]